MNKKIFVIAIALMFLMAPIYGANALTYGNSDRSVNQSIAQNTAEDNANSNPLSNFVDNNFDTSMIETNYTSRNYPKNWDFIKYLSDNPNEYKKIWEPWITKAAIHAIALSPDKTFMAVGGGYLYDNEIHIYRWNYVTKSYDKVWDSGDGVIRGDILSLAIDDTDNNNLKEIIAGSADGHIYVFEQRHIYDPITNMENMFDLVWKSEFIGPVWAVGVFDADKDYIKDIVAGTWYDKVYFYEYYNHSRYPFTPDHWIEYRKVWDSGDAITSHVTSLGFGDLNGNGLPDILVGLRNGGLVLFENNGTVIDINGYMFPLTQDNSYKETWRNEYAAFTPILRISVNDTDGDDVDEASVIAVTQSAFILDYDKSREKFNLIKLYYPPMSYEVGLGVKGEYPIDNWADWMIYGNNVYFYNGTVNMTEPIENYREMTGIEFNNTAMGGPPDWKYSRFLSNSTINATAIIDFGVQEESVGDGTNASDIYILFRYVTGFDNSIDPDKIRFYASYDGVKYVELTNYTVYQYPYDFRVYFDIDPILANYSWRHIRYLKIFVYNGGRYAIDAIYTYQIDKQLTDVVTTLITSLKINYGEVRNYILFGTIQGKLIIYHYNMTTAKYEMLYDSYYEDNFILNTHIWYIIKAREDTRYPYWIKSTSYSIDLSGQVLNSYDLYDLDKDGDLDLIAGTTNGGIMYFEKSSSGFSRNTFVEDYVFGLVNSEIASKSYIIVRMGDVLSNAGPELMVTYLDPGQSRFYGYIYYLSNQYNLSYSPTYSYSLTDIEITYKLEEEFSYVDATNFPFLDFADVNGDGLTDILVSNGRLHLLRCVRSNPPQYILDENYFKEINENTKRKLISARFVDINMDGIYDVIASYFGKKGSTYYENIGTSTDPKWVEKKQMFSNSVRSMNPVTNFAFNNFTHSLITYDEREEKFTLVAYNLFDQKLYYFNGETSNIDTLAIATYPLLMEINLGPIFSDTYLNFGYHIIDVWSTREELRGWTQAIAHADLDQDGNGEIIVGDFDNNVYVFEHLTNNTYKRAYRTRDLYYEYETTQSPYYSGELGGLPGTFKRRVWEHARYIAADTDIDNDGRLEMIVATKYQVLVFEHVKYENYELEYQYSLLNHSLWPWIYLYTDGISAFAYSGDMDYNGYGEIVLAADYFMFVLELTDDGDFVETFNSLTLNSLLETSTFASLGGVAPRTPTYLLPGNMFTYIYDSYFDSGFENYLNFKINALAVGDLDNNGNTEIFIGGRNNTYNCASYRDGLLYVIENEFGTYYLKWIAPENVTWRNEINSLVIDDQDYDGYKELIIGGSKGIDVFEHSDTSYLTYVNSITSSLNHPLIKNSAVINGTGSFDNYEIQSNDIVILENGRIISFFVSDYSVSGMDTEIYYSYSDDNGKTWSSIVSLTGGSGYGAAVYFEKYISAVRDSSYGDVIHLAWYASVSAVAAQYNIYYAKINGTDLTFITGPTIVASDDSDSLISVKIWKYPITTIILNIQLYDLGISYFNLSDYYFYFYVHETFPVSSWTLHPNTPKMYYGIYDVYSIYYRMYDIAYIGDNKWIMVFTGLNWNKSSSGQLPYSLYDIFAMTANSTFNWSRPVEVYSSLKSDVYPVVDYYASTDTIIAMFMAPTSGFRYDIYASSSRDGGVTWSKAKQLYKWHPRVYEICNITLRYYWKSRTGSLSEIAKHDTSWTAISVNSKGEFVFSYPVMIRFFIGDKWDDIYDVVAGYRDNVDWANTLLGDVRTLAVGDSDMDNRREIVSNYYEDGFTVFEVTASQIGSRSYNQTFIYEHLNNTLFDISIGDSNGNGWPEIVVSTNFGNVYSFEFKYSNWVATSMVIPDLVGSEKVLTGSINVIDFGTGNFDSDSALEYYFTYNGNMIGVYDIETKSLTTKDLVNTIKQTLLEDVDGDGVSEIIVSLDNGTIMILDGYLNVVNVTSYIAGSIAIKGNYLVASNESAYTVIYDLSSLTVKWEYNLGSSSPVKQVDLAFDHENISKVILHLQNESLYAIDYVYKNITWKLYFKSQDSAKLLVTDLNGNGRDEIIGQNFSTWLFFTSMESNITVIDSKDGEILRNIVIPFYDSFNKLELINLDNDSYEDIFVLSGAGAGVISTKNYEFVWVKNYNLYVKAVSLGDFDDDGYVDFLVSQYNSGDFMLSNGYGNVYMYYSAENSINLSLVIEDYNNDGSSEIYGILSNGTFIVIKSTSFSERLTGVAYYEPSLEASIKTFNSAHNGFIKSADFDGDGFEEIAVSNETYLALISAKNNTVLWTVDMNMTIRDMIIGEYRVSGVIVIAVNDWENVSIFNIYGEEIFDKQLADLQLNSYILKMHIGDFDGDGRGELLVVTNGGTWVIDNNEATPIYLNPAIVYTITGDFDGDGARDIAYKDLVTGVLYVMKGDGSGNIWYKTIGTTKATKKLPDIFTLDYNSDGRDDIVFTNSSGEINIFNGPDGSYLATIPTGIESYGISIDHDKLLHTSGGLVIKYANYGFYVFDSAGNILFNLPDKSTASYVGIDVDWDGNAEYFAMTSGKIIGLNASGLIYYKNLMEVTFAMTTINEYTINAKKIAVIGASGLIYDIKLANSLPKQVTRTDDPTPIEPSSIIPLISLLYLPIMILVALPFVLHLRKKKKSFP